MKSKRKENWITAEELMKKTCGEGLNAKAFCDFLEEKYYKLYNIKE